MNLTAYEQAYLTMTAAALTAADHARATLPGGASTAGVLRYAAEGLTHLAAMNASAAEECFGAAMRAVPDTAEGPTRLTVLGAFDQGVLRAQSRAIQSASRMPSTSDFLDVLGGALFSLSEPDMERATQRFERLIAAMRAGA